MRRRVALALIASSSVARAEDPKDVFEYHLTQVEQVDCTSTDVFGCVSTPDPFEPGYALRTWLPTTYVLRLPVGDARHDDVADFAIGASRDDVGVSFGGATGLENTWTIDGAPIENLANGNVDTRIPLAFTRGLWVTAGGFAARDRAGLGGSIEAELVRGTKTHEVHAYAWTGLSADPRDRPIAAGVYQVRRVDFDPLPKGSFAVVATGPGKSLRGGTWWYAAGVAGFVSRFDVDGRASRLVDVDGDGIPDGLPGTADAGGDGKIDLETVGTSNERVTAYAIPFLARTGWDRDAHSITLTLLGVSARDSAFVSNATPQASGTDRTTLLADGIASWKGRWNYTRAFATLAWHRSVRREHARDGAAADVPQLQAAYVPDQLDDPRIAAGCTDGAGDVAPTIPNCPVPFGFFLSGGAGELNDSVGDRPTVTGEIARLYGHHTLRVGGTFEDTRLVTTARFTGGELQRSLFTDHLDTTHFIGPDGCGASPGTLCNYVDESELIYRTRYTAAYLEDTFRISPRIRVDTGVRWELMWVGPHLHFSNEWAPRLGVVWDLKGDGSTRWWASMGRTHALLPAGMGPIVIARDPRVRDIEFGDIVDRRIDNGNVFSVARDVQAIAQDEVATGFELGVIQALRGGVWVQQRTLRRGLETVQQNPLLDIAIDNPGRAGPFAGRDARRDSTTLAAEVTIAPGPKLAFRATYLWGRTVGSWTGPFDPRQGTTLYAGTDWDLDATNLYGRLPTDPGHRVAIEGERRGTLGGVELAVSTRLTVANGRPRNVLADSDFGIVQLLPRGSNGRTPTVSQADARLAARWHGTDFTLDVVNAFDRQTAVTTAEIYAGDQVHPIVNGTLQDLVFAKNESCGEESCTAEPAGRRTTFGLPTSFQRPVSVVFGVRRVF